MQQSKWKECRKKRHEKMILVAKALARNSGIFIPFDLERASEKEVEDFVKRVVKECKNYRREEK
jgi:hypothetical protein